MPSHDPTPCPAPGMAPRRSSLLYRASEDDTFSGRIMHRHTREPQSSGLSVHWEDGDNDTANIEFTTDIQAMLRSAPARRRKSVAPKPRGPAEVVIHEDDYTNDRTAAKLASENLAPSRTAIPRNRRSSVLSRPTLDGDGNRRSILGLPAHRMSVLQETAEQLKPSRRRVSSILADREAEMRSKAQPEMSKALRRNTIYMPQDNTTVTITPGSSWSTSQPKPKVEDPQKYDLMTLSEEDEPQRPVDKAPKRMPRKSLAAAPKKVPLQISSRVMQDSTMLKDIPGTGGGKENLAPERKKSADVVITINGLKAMQKSKLQTSMNGATTRVMDSKPLQSSPASRKRASNIPITDSSRHKLRKSDERKSSPSSEKQRPRSWIESTEVEQKSKPQPKAPSKLLVPAMVQLAKSHQERYPVLSEDIARPELYEDSWLSCQESAITQLLNGLFKAVEHDSEEPQQPIRKRMLDIYHRADIVLLHKRLQASLLYGALAVPKETLSKHIRLRDDIGLRRKFMDLWLDNYDLGSLKVASEVVFGRECQIKTRLSSDSPQRLVKSQRKALEAFLETFLVRHEDAVRHKPAVGSIGSIARGAKSSEGPEFGSHSWAWNRTILRSLMLVLLLDIGKREKVMTGCLFLKSSQLKSSAAVLQALANLLIPSIGDVMRPLGHIKYQIEHTQYPLEEYDYQVTNLATDLRDGVRLTRVVELLLYPSTDMLVDREVTFTMPTGDVLTGSREDSWVLSNHLKFPSIARAQKLYNTQIALSALSNVSRGPLALRDVRAEDIVDGHREKSVGLLWALVSRWGLPTILDEKELRKEIRRLEASCPSEDDQSDFDEEEYDCMRDLEQYTYLLKSWASAVAKLHGLRVNNLSSSFADGTVFERIIDQYETYLPVTSSLRRSSRHGLEDKLKKLGCSNSFASIFSHANGMGRVFDKDFVIAALAFLCSRLLQASVKGRAATTIQRAFRASRVRQDVHRRIVLLKLAHDCMVVVQTRDRVIGAATIIQRAYKAHLHRKITELVEWATSLQSMARGAVVRRNERGFWR